jgi:predicted acyltransferase
VCWWWCDLKPSTLTERVTEPLVALGRNAILLFFVSGWLAETIGIVKWPDPGVSVARWIYMSAFLPLASPRTASLMYALANLAVLYALLAWLHRRRVYLTV